MMPPLPKRGNALKRFHPTYELPNLRAYRDECCLRFTADRGKANIRSFLDVMKTALELEVSAARIARVRPFVQSTKISHVITTFGTLVDGLKAVMPFSRSSPTNGPTAITPNIAGHGRLQAARAMGLTELPASPCPASRRPRSERCGSPITRLHSMPAGTWKSCS